MHKTLSQLIVYLECPCCGDDGAVSDARGRFADGQPLICGCRGWVSVDGESEPMINNGEEPCWCLDTRC